MNELAPQTNQNRLVEEKNQLAVELSYVLNNIVRLHGKTLAIKMQQTIYKDAYGTEIYDKFIVECDYFIKTVMFKSVPSDIWHFFFGDRSHQHFFHEAFTSYLNSANFKAIAGLDITADTTSQEFVMGCISQLSQAGWSIRGTKGTGNQCIDVVAEYEGETLVLQCKLYSKPVGKIAVQEVVVSRQLERSQFAAVVSNTGYTASARKLAASLDVYLLHHLDLPSFHKQLGVRTLYLTATAPVQQNPAESHIQPSSCQLDERPINEILQQAEMLMDEMQLEEAKDKEEVLVEKDTLYESAVAVVFSNRKASISLVQRHLKISYNRAARLLEDMEKNGLISSMSESGQREILMSMPVLIDGQGAIGSQSVDIDKTSIREMVEDYWRSFIMIGRENPSAGASLIRRFDERIVSMAALMPSEKAKPFLLAIENEREKLFAEYEFSPAALRSRLNLPPAQIQAAQYPSSHKGQNLAGLVVKTAVRATVWEIVRSLFRR